jgi:putative inorganic carbon (HCO3(-)) transporter
MPTAIEQMPHEGKCAVPICHGGFAGARDFVGRLRLLGPSSFVVALLSPFFALTLGSVHKILLAIALLDIPFQFGTHLFYQEHEAASGALGGLSISATTIALFGLYLSWFLRSMALRNRYSRRSIDFNLPLVFYLACTSLSMLAAQDVSLAFYELFLLLQLYLVYVYVANNVRTQRDLLFVMSLLLVGCLIEGLAMIALRFTGMPSTIWGLPTHIHIQTGAREAFMRIGGTIGSSNEASAYLSLLLTVAASFLFTNIGRSYKGLAAAVLGIGGVALILTFARGGWLAFILALVMLCFLIWRRGGLPLRAPVAILAVLMLLYLPFSGDISTRLFGDDKGSAESRIPLTYLAFRIIGDYPVLGAGVNNFSVVMDRYLTPEFRHGFLYAVHNKYLLIWAETGIGALLAYLAFLFGSLRKGWECWKLSDRFLSVLALGFTAAIVGHMVHMSVDLFRVGPVQELLWLFAALLTAMRRMSAAPSASEVLSGIS